jgi:hypothetical protein
VALWSSVSVGSDAGVPGGQRQGGEGAYTVVMPRNSLLVGRCTACCRGLLLLLMVSTNCKDHIHDLQE